MARAPSQWSPDEWCAAVGQYSYPAVRLVCANGKADLEVGDLRLVRDDGGAVLPTSLEIEAFHRNLLLSEDRVERLHGVLSVVYWGYFAGANGRRVGYGLARTRWVALGFDPARDPTALAADAVRDGKWGAALNAYRRLFRVGASFASKMVAFAAPESTGVLDSVLCRALLQWGELAEVGERFLLSSTSDAMRAELYERWCEFCRDHASNLNKSGSCWTDHMARRREWRAVDIERAIFFKAGMKA